MRPSIFTARRLSFLLPFLLSLTVAVGSPAAVIRVSRGASAPEDGQSWGSAFRTVGAALLASRPGDEIWIASGVYTENLTLKNGVDLYGGFAGTEMDRSQRDWKIHGTVMDGSRKGSVISALFGVTARVDGLSLRNGSGRILSSLGTGLHGGGVAADRAILTLANCRIEENTVTGSGGGIAGSGATLQVLNCRIAGNTAKIGGGLYLKEGRGSVTATRITANTAEEASGMWIGGYNRVTGCTILQNTGAGSAVTISQAAKVVNNTIVHNESRSYAQHVVYGSAWKDAECSNNIIAFNSHAVARSGPNVFPIRNNNLFGNTVANSSGLEPLVGRDGNISVNPMLVSHERGEVHLQPDSPCRDAGDNSLVLVDDRDMDGQERLGDGRVDIGADESDGTVWSVDIPILRVHQSGDDARDGQSWATAKRTIRAASSALPETGGEIWVAEGVYQERITLPSYTEVYGGFSGTESSRDQRDWTVYKCIVDGAQGGSVVRVPRSSVRVVLDGFTVTNGRAGFGGGIAWSGAWGRISHNTIRENTAVASATETGDGGGLFADQHWLLVENNLIVRNTGPYGAGIAVPRGEPTIRNNTIADNQGRGVYILRVIPLENNIVAFNTSNRISGVSAGSVARSNCLYGDDYGTVYTWGLSGNMNADPQFVDRAAGDYRLRPTSPCIDSGYDAGIEDGILDLDRQPRIQSVRVDIGAFEHAGPRVYTGAQRAYVRTDGDDTRDGLTWESARRTLKAGLDAVRPGGELWVASGTYVEHIVLQDGIGLYGGFTGTETLREETRPGLTVIEGDGTRPVVVSPFTVTATTVLDGFTLRNHGWIHCDGGAPLIRRNVIKSSEQIAIRCEPGSAPRITDNLITGNPGLRSIATFAAISAFYADVVIERNQIADNAGNAIDLSYGSGVVEGNRIERNGGGMVVNQGTYRIERNVLRDNGREGIDAGVASVVIRGNVLTGGNLTLRGSHGLVSHNTVVGHFSYERGAVHFDAGEYVFSNNIVAYNGGGVSRSTYTAPKVVLRANCTFGNREFDYQGFPEPSDASGNISADPMFANVQSGELHIQPGSPCRDTGDPLVVEPGELDIDGQPRFQGDAPDIGADESDGTFWPGTTRVVRVRPDGSDDQSGDSWESAVKTIPAAIQAVSSQGGGEVWVAAGTYQGIVTIRGFTAVYGGFAGTETTRDQRDWKRNTTTLEAENDISSSRAVVFDVGATICALDGFTVTGANNGYIGNSAALNCGNWSQPIIRNNVIRDNMAAAIYCGEGASPTIEENTITGTGGRVFEGTRGHFVISRNRITGNFHRSQSLLMITFGGGGVFSNNVVDGNTTWDGRVVLFSSREPILIANNTFVGNRVQRGVGNTALKGTVTVGEKTVRLVNNLVAFNATGLEWGALQPALAEFTANCVYGNSVDYINMDSQTGLNGNISADPLLADASYGNLHLRPGSPCIDTGRQVGIPLGATDIDGEPRVQGAAVDIGADESDGTDWPPGPAVLRVRPDGDDTRDGLTWATAKRTVPDALRTLEASATRGAVWVAEGLYPGRFLMGPYISLYGGFGGDETERSQRNPTLHPTVLDGMGQAPVVTIRSGGTDTVFDGFTVRNGGLAAGATPLPGASGLLAELSLATISNNVFTGNAITDVPVLGVRYGEPTIEANTLTANSGDIALAETYGMVRGNVLEGSGIKADGGDNSLLGNTVRNGRITLMGNGKILNNVIHNTTLGGSAVTMGPTVSVAYPTATLGGNVIAHLAGDRGPTINVTSSPRIINNTIVGRKTQAAAIQGDGEIDVTNNIFAHFLTGVYGRVATLRHNDFYDVFTPYDLSGSPQNVIGLNANIAANPVFTDETARNYRPQPGSPCIDAGFDAVLIPDWTDPDGQPRWQGSHVDIGAFEFGVPGTYAMSELIDLLRVVAGLDGVNAEQLSRLDVAMPPDGVLSLVDAAVLGRKLTGLDANP